MVISCTGKITLLFLPINIIFLAHIWMEGEVSQGLFFFFFWWCWKEEEDNFRNDSKGILVRQKLEENFLSQSHVSARTSLVRWHLSPLYFKGQKT